MMRRHMTLPEKLLARAASRDHVRPGEFVRARADSVVLCDLAWSLVGPAIAELGASVVGPERVLVTFDHKVPADSAAIASLHRNWREFCAKHRIEALYDIGRQGVSHVLSVEDGHALPGTLQVNVDTHANTCGAVGCFAIALGVDVLSDLVLGWNWHRVPETILVELKGELQRGVTARDVAQTVMAAIGADQGAGRAVEFRGSFIDRLEMSGRMVLCNWTRKIEAVTGVIAADAVTAEYVAKRARRNFQSLSADSNAQYAINRRFDVGCVEPVVALPPSPLDVHPVSAIAGRPVQQAVIGSCAGGHLEDLRLAASLLRGRRVASGTRLIISPATRSIWTAAANEGLLGVFVEAGAIVTDATCGACFGGTGVLADGETCISSSTENMAGRMGSDAAEILLASPLTVAASAIAGAVADPRGLDRHD